MIPGACKFILILLCEMHKYSCLRETSAHYMLLRARVAYILRALAL